ncbi:MAG: hypothetical protein AW07_01166 [Candidatus Accumulibacter sp. SK-11]|nr:MAG: hypothetical protein AW07_01166 [Candidatus Accumulibacter sp. SK-11]
MTLLQCPADLAGSLQRPPRDDRCRTEVKQPAGHRPHLIDDSRFAHRRRGRRDLVRHGLPAVAPAAAGRCLASS